MSTIYLTYNLRYNRLFCEGLGTSYEFFDVDDIDVLMLYDFVWDYIETRISMLSSDLDYFCEWCGECEECDDYSKLLHSGELNVYNTFTNNTSEVLYFEARLS